MSTTITTATLPSSLSTSTSKPACPSSSPNTTFTTPNPNTSLTKTLHRISLHPTLTPYRRRLYRTLLSIPPGRWTTYSALSAYLGSSPRAVGNALRTNPFAPGVPCHRVLGSGGCLGGYKGFWAGRSGGATGANGKREGKGEEKRELLEEEGVVFDGEGKARGVCFRGFVEVGGKGK
ncbi:MGMT family protein [Aspergillus chevalieri]|uniref:Methylated-DNA--protein-cysteine methyltransferase n=1 Tax=Aspergillus chevalieri TaxID=182096 RepID=A0A7R7ZNT4_ASPCH|nr:methylated-DNA--protein-cysteine methyltransferase [Aspergillus chevalieri]BCR87891.1 methylated-DNA--protein-cysteine methyltransferase [Aspergillus chevalieri]